MIQTQIFISISLHYLEEIKAEWEQWREESLIPMVHNLMDITSFYWTDVALLPEGKIDANVLLLGFENQETVEGFLQNELIILEEAIQNEFNEGVLLMKSQLSVLEQGRFI